MAVIHGNDSSEEINSLDGVTNGADAIYGHGGVDDIYGHGGNDNIFGGDGDDWIFGMGDNDTLKGGGGADHLYGSTGNDTATYLDSPTAVLVSLRASGASGYGRFGTAEGDTLNSIENLEGSLYGDQLYGSNESDNVLTGLWGDDVLWGRRGADTLEGGEGTDTASYNDSLGVYVSLITGRGYSGSATGDTLVSIENLYGSSADDLFVGNDGVNLLDGQRGDDSLKGGGGVDTLIGGEDDDILDGGGDADLFLFDTPLDDEIIVDPDTNIDRITDFNVTDDTIRLDRDIFSSSTLSLGSVAGSQFVVGAAALDAGDRIIYDNATGVVLYDSDGFGGVDAIQFATLSAGLGMTITNHDFFVVA